MASEDSDQVVPGFLAIHGLRNLCDRNEPVRAQMSAGRDQLEAARKRLEITLLRGAHRVLTKERNDRFVELRSTLHQVVAQVLAVIVVTLVDEDPSHPEELSELLEARHALLALRNGESMRYLIAGSVALPLSLAWLPNKAD